MTNQYIFIPYRISAQAVNYGDDDYSTQVYSCEEDTEACATADPNTPGVTTNAGSVPSTGFLGMSQEAALTAIGGGILLLVALTAAIIFAARRSKKRNNITKG